MEAKQDWTSKLAGEFRDYFYGERGGDYPLSATEVKFSNFEKNYIESVYRELCLCNFLIDYKPAQIGKYQKLNASPESIQMLFFQYNSIQEKFVYQPRFNRDQYDLCPVHPIQELISHHYPLWNSESHETIQNFIMDRLFLYDSNPLVGPDERTIAIAMSMHSRLGQNSGIHSLNHEMMKVINKHTLLDKLREIDVNEEAYLQTLKRATLRLAKY